MCAMRVSAKVIQDSIILTALVVISSVSIYQMGISYATSEDIVNVQEPHTLQEQSIAITMDKTTYSYCEKLLYTITVSNVTGELAIVHIRDEAGKSSSAIHIDVNNLQTPVPSLFVFEKEVYPLGKYYIDVEYAGMETTTKFVLVDNGKVCIPSVMRTMMASWLGGGISDGFMIDAFNKFVDKELVIVPFEINNSNIYDIIIPEWVKYVGFWWLEGTISDDTLAKTFVYLMEKDVIKIQGGETNHK